MAHHTLASGTTKLSQDISTLINNRQGSDVHFKVGGNVRQENGETIHDESAIVTIYAHSAILRCRSQYFAAILDKEDLSKERTNSVICRPDISPETLLDILHYIYTGNVQRVIDYSGCCSERIFELITIADEMKLEEPSVKYQTELVREIEFIFSENDDLDDENESGEIFEGLINPCTSTDVALVWRIVTQALNLSTKPSFSHLSQILFDIILPRMSVIIVSPTAYTTLLNGISSETFAKIIASNNLGLTECSIWNLVLSWGCHHTNLIKTAVEERLKEISNSDDDEDNDVSSNGAVVNEMGASMEPKSDYSTISITQLKQLKAILVPFLPAIRFSLFEAKNYSRMIYAISYFLPRRRFLELQYFFLDPDYIGQLDSPRMETLNIAGSMIIIKYTMWKHLRKSIFETGGITGCVSSKNLKFDLLFRASEHGFLATTFHQRCDNKGPTLVLVRDADGDLFGGVNFVHWKSDESWSSSSLNFLFTFLDRLGGFGGLRTDYEVFAISGK